MVFAVSPAGCCTHDVRHGGMHGRFTPHVSFVIHHDGFGAVGGGIRHGRDIAHPRGVHHGKPSSQPYRSTRFPNVTVTVYAVDGIERFEATPSKGLSTDPDVAREEALQRIGQLDVPETDAAKHAALGLVRAARLGIDRVPAIVLDGELVVYGVTDLEVALDRLFAESQELTP